MRVAPGHVGRARRAPRHCPGRRAPRRRWSRRPAARGRRRGAGLGSCPWPARPPAARAPAAGAAPWCPGAAARRRRSAAGVKSAPCTRRRRPVAPGWARRARVRRCPAGRTARWPAPREGRPCVGGSRRDRLVEPARLSHQAEPSLRQPGEDQPIGPGGPDGGPPGRTQPAEAVVFSASAFTAARVRCMPSTISSSSLPRNSKLAASRTGASGSPTRLRHWVSTVPPPCAGSIFQPHCILFSFTWKANRLGCSHSMTLHVVGHRARPCLLNPMKRAPTAGPDAPMIHLPPVLDGLHLPVWVMSDTSAQTCSGAASIVTLASSITPPLAIAMILVRERLEQVLVTSGYRLVACPRSDGGCDLEH